MIGGLAFPATASASNGHNHQTTYVQHGQKGHKHDRNCEKKPENTTTTAPTTVPENTTPPDLPGEVVVPDAPPAASVPDEDVPYTVTREETPEVTPYVGVPDDSPVKGAPISFTG